MNKTKRIKLLLASIFLLFAFIVAIPANFAYSAVPTSEFRSNSLTAYRTIRINATDMGTMSTEIITISTETLFRPQFSPISTLDESEEQYDVFYDEITPIRYGSPSSALYDTRYFAVNDSTKVYYCNDSQNLYSYASSSAFLGGLGDARLSGNTYSCVLPPAYDLALFYCQENGLLLNSVEDYNTTISYDIGSSSAVNYFAVATTYPQEPDTNLLDGYTLEPLTSTMMMPPQGHGQLGTSVVHYGWVIPLIKIALTLAAIVALFIFIVNLPEELRAMFPPPAAIPPMPNNFTNDVTVTLPAIDNMTQQVLTAFLNGTIALSDTIALLNALANFYPRDLGVSTTYSPTSTNGGDGAIDIFAFLQDAVQYVVIFVVIICGVYGVIWLLRAFRRKD